MRKIQLFVTIFLLHVAPFRLKALDNKEAINSVVKVKATPSTIIYGDLVEKNGLGCIIDKSQGFILITKELANHLSICKYEITFQNGTRVEARLKYFDPWVNFAVLQVNAGDIPKEYKAAVFTNKKFKGNEIVYAASMQGDSITMVEGFLLEKYSVYESPMPQQCYQAQLKSNGIFLSAPIFDAAGCLVSISQKSDSGRLMFLDPEYLRELVGDNKFSTRRVRKNIGAICELYPLADALEFRKVPKDFFDRYQKNLRSSEEIF